MRPGCSHRNSWLLWMLNLNMLFHSWSITPCVANAGKHLKSKQWKWMNLAYKWNLRSGWPMGYSLSHHSIQWGNAGNITGINCCHVDRVAAFVHICTVRCQAWWQVKTCPGAGKSWGSFCAESFSLQHTTTGYHGNPRARHSPPKKVPPKQK